MPNNIPPGSATDESALDRIFVLPGEIAFAKKPTMISTLLGSCVAVCLYHPSLKIGGLNHYMLPTKVTILNNSGMRVAFRPESKADLDELAGKYGDFAIPALISMMKREIPTLNGVYAQVYGGGKVVGHLEVGTGIGDKNIEIALRMLDEARIPVKKTDVGKDFGRRVYFNTTTGDVRIAPIQKSALTVEMERKKADLSSRKIRVLIVDDSPTVRKVINRGLSADPMIEIVGEAQDAFEARSMMLELDPDVLTLDIIMPKLDGLNFLKKLMIHYPKPIVIVSTMAKRGSDVPLRAKQIGAVDVVDKDELKIYKGVEFIRNVLAPKVINAARQVVLKKNKDDIMHI